MNVKFFLIPRVTNFMYIFFLFFWFHFYMFFFSFTCDNVYSANIIWLLAQTQIHKNNVSRFYFFGFSYLFLFFLILLPLFFVSGSPLFLKDIRLIHYQTFNDNNSLSWTTRNWIPLTCVTLGIILCERMIIFYKTNYNDKSIFVDILSLFFLLSVVLHSYSVTFWSKAKRKNSMKTRWNLRWSEL